VGAEVDFISKRSSGGRPLQTATPDQPGGGFGPSGDLTGLDRRRTPKSPGAARTSAGLCCTPEPNRKQG